jgi:hypothetical protein
VLALVVLRRRVPPQVRSGLSTGGWILLPLIVAIVAWFLAAPEPRYARAFFWCLAVLLWCRAFQLRLAASARTRVWPIVLPAGVLAISPIFISPWISAESPYHGSNPLSAILKSNLNRPGPDLWFQPLEDKPVLFRYRTRSGLELNTVKNQCWDAPLPCTKTPAPNLRLRRPPDLSSGFVVDGPWQMENWPTGRQPAFLETWRKSPAGRAAHQASLHSSRP